MPYRRLPNTDQARLRAMKQAYSMGQTTHPSELAYSQKTYTKLSLFINSFELAVSQYRQAYAAQSESSPAYQTALSKGKLYVSHFIQVANMAILRGELKPEARAYYGLPENDGRLPSLAADSEVVEWGKRIIEGEAQRATQGKPPVTNPNIALVRVHYENFVDAYNHQKVLQQNSARTLKKLKELPATADAIILSIWNEVEAHFSELPLPSMREHARVYGVVYIYRKNEIHDDPQRGETLLSPETESIFQAFMGREGR